MSEYAALGFFIALGAGVVLLLFGLAALVGPRLRFAEKLEPFECGERQIVSPYQRFNVRFYMVAVSFIIFDVELVFLYPWAVVFKDLGWLAFISMLLFIFALCVGLAYEWLKGGLDWK